MSDTSVRQIDEALRALQGLAGASAPPSTRRVPRPKPRSARRALVRLGTGLLGLGVLALLPFVLLVRGATYVHFAFGLAGWPAVLLSAGLTALLLTGYAWIASWGLTGRIAAPRLTAKLMLVIVALYCGYASLHISATNVKEPALQATYTTLHPVLRLAVSTLVLADPALVVTDAERVPEDYARMGLPPRERSLHFRQASGYVHAVDLRTQGRPAWRNALVTVYFRAMGLHTLRHVGTADHLHVSLPLPGNGK